MRSDAPDKKPKPRIVLNNDRLHKKLRKLPNFEHAYQLANHMGIHPTQLGRVLNSQSRPGEEFIAALLLAMGITEFGDGLFNITLDEEVA